MYDCPEKTMYIAGAIYCVIGFFTFPFLTLFYFGLSLFAVLKPAGDFSESERRPLEQLPELSIKTLLNGDFMDNFENYTNDQFPMRDTFRAVKALAKYYVLCYITS